ncbi:MAG: hypothetical protein L3J47_10020 [Sulfurovum sp.]|nr:hypothetical protein [Sulfurovum sp.]
MPLTEEQRQEIAKKEEYIALKEKLLTKRKSLQLDLEHAQDTVEEGLIEEERERLAQQIKTLAANIRQIEEWEALV